MTQAPYLQHLPPVFAGIRVFSAIASVADAAFSQAYDDLDGMISSLTPDTGIGDYLEIYESFFGITPVSGESDAKRRFRLLSVGKGWLPFTSAWLSSKLTELFGEGNFTVATNSASFTLNVTIDTDDDEKFDICDEMIRAAAPANLAITVARS